MKKYLSGAGAARVLGVNEKTVRSWVRSGKLHARKAAKNRFDILAVEVEALRREREQDEAPDVSVLVARIEDVESKYANLERKYSELEQKYQELTSRVVGKVGNRELSALDVAGMGEISRPQKSVVVVSAGVSVDMPDGSMLYADFAAKYGVPRATFTHHIKKGIGGEIVETMKRPKPGRPDHMEYWLTPEQQDAALTFWERHGVVYTRS